MYCIYFRVAVHTFAGIRILRNTPHKKNPPKPNLGEHKTHV